MKKPNYSGKRYIALVRASHLSDEISTDAQLKMIKEIATSMGMIHVDDVVSDGLTGSLPGKRSDLEAILERKRTKNDFNVLAMQRVDRLTRSGTEHAMWFTHECRRLGIEIIYVGDDIPTGRYSELIMSAKCSAAQEQAFSISQDAADTVIKSFSELSASLKTMPIFPLRQLVAALVERVVGDMETRDIEVVLRIPALSMPKTGNGAMRPVEALPSHGIDQTHQFLVVSLGSADCHYIRKARKGCYSCRRNRAA